MLDTIASVLGKFFDKDALPVNTLLGIQALAVPEFLVEMEATAVL
jgi:enamine deaminase RidA (YjgF/YER057c/UK114 family)